MSVRPIGEVVAILEQKVTDLDAKFSDMASDIRIIKESLSTSGLLKVEIEGLKVKVADLSRRNALWSWLSPTLSAFFSAFLSSVVTFLVISYFTSTVHK